MSAHPVRLGDVFQCLTPELHKRKKGVSSLHHILATPKKGYYILYCGRSCCASCTKYPGTLVPLSRSAPVSLSFFLFFLFFFFFLSLFAEGERKKSQAANIETPPPPPPIHASSPFPVGSSRASSKSSATANDTVATAILPSTGLQGAATPLELPGTKPAVPCPVGQTGKYLDLVTRYATE